MVKQRMERMRSRTMEEDPSLVDLGVYIFIKISIFYPKGSDDENDNVQASSVAPILCSMSNVI